MNKILKSYRIKKRWFLLPNKTLKYNTSTSYKPKNCRISGTIKSLNKKNSKNTGDTN